jgi:hypothetical protein
MIETEVSVNDTFGAFLSNYIPSQETTNFLDKYLIQEGIKIESTNNSTVKGRESYVEALDRHFSRLKMFLDSGKDSVVNLVFGNVQSGKTGHLLANICWARDLNFHLAIVFTGSISDLGEQTVDRLKKKLPENTAFIISSPTESGLNSALLDPFNEKFLERVNSSKVPIPVITLIKSPARLAAVRKIIWQLNRITSTRMRVIILDDEADQASVDATANNRSISIPDINLNSYHADRVTIHNRINEIRDEVNGQLVYLAYTATPQALILGDLYGPLQPEYCSVVSAGEEYTSIGDLVRNKNTLVKLDNVSDSTSLDENLNALDKCFTQFLILSWLHKRHANIFHSKGAEKEYNCPEESIQFLIHPSGLSSEHQIFKDAMDNCLNDFKILMENEDKHEFLEEYFKPAFLIISNKYDEKIRLFLETDKQKLDCWDYVINLIKSTNRLKIKLVNYKERKNLSSQSSLEPLVPTSPGQWQEAEAWVLIGGDILGRGLTIPHLVITLFLRNPRNPNFDTAVQQMRFCGYRKSYLPIIQIYAPEDIVDDYFDAVQIDEPFRARALRWDLTSRNLIEEPTMLKFIAPSTTRFRATRNSVLSAEIVVRNNTGSSGFFSLAKIANPRRFVRNTNLMLDLIQGMPIYEKYLSNETESIIYSIDESKIRKLFMNWDTNDSEKTEFLTMFELLGYPVNERGLAHLECLLSVDKSITDFVSGEGAHANYSDITQLPFRTMSGILSEGNWKDFQDLKSFDFIEAKQIVGGTERLMRTQFSEKVFIQCRLYDLLNPSALDSGIGSRNPKGRGLGMGLSLIGWIPDSEEEYYVNQEIGRSFVRQ